MTIHFITFAAGSQDYYNAGNRIIKQANCIKLFDKTTLFTDVDLKSDPEFWNKHSSFVENNKRGYGYWLWKPYTIKKTMEKLNNGDILLYLDCGCEFNPKKRGNLLKLFEFVNRELIIGTETGNEEKEWNKMDLLTQFSPEFAITSQRQAGTLLFLVCDKTRIFVNEWYDLASDYHNIDDSPSILPNHVSFKEHRHDQSIYSLLSKKHGFLSVNSLFDGVECCRNRTGNARF